MRNKLTAHFEGLSQRIEEKRRAPDESIALGEAVTLLAALRVRGNTVELNGDKVTVRGPALDEPTIARCRELKPALVRLLEAEAAR